MSKLVVALPPPGTYALDAAHNFVYFAAQHQLVGMVRGRFNKMSGTIIVEKDPAACAVDVSIEAPSVDTQERNAGRRSSRRGFFDSKTFPAIRYRGKGIRRSGDRWLIVGSLTIRGVEKAVPLEFVFKGTAPSQPGKPSRVAFHASASAKRADFGMTRELLKVLHG